MKKAVKWLVAASLMAPLAGMLPATAAAQDFSGVDFSGVEGTIYLLVPSSKISRYVKFEVPNMTAALAHYAPNAKLEVLNANDQVSEQVAQVDAAIANGAAGIILISVDPNQSGGMLAKADADGIPVVTFAQDVGKGPVRYHVTVPFLDIGQAQGQYMVDHLPEARPVRMAYMLGDPKFAFYVEQMKGVDAIVDPKVADGTVEIVCRADALLWVPANAQRNMEQCLTQTDNGVDGVFIMNDDTGSGVMAALSAQGLEGKVTIYGGYDATLEAVQRVMVGWQAATMSPPYKAMDEKAILLILSAIAGTEPPAGIVNGSWDNGFVEGGVPTSYTPNIFITPDNIQETVIDAGLWSRDELCSGFAAQSAFCTAP
jgi:D-xylose transport system substrate-binding protein